MVARMGVWEFDDGMIVFKSLFNLIHAGECPCPICIDKIFLEIKGSIHAICYKIFLTSKSESSHQLNFKNNGTVTVLFNTIHMQ